MQSGDTDTDARAGFRLILSSAAREFRGSLVRSVLRIAVTSAIAGSAASVAPALIGFAIDAVVHAPPPGPRAHGISAQLARLLHGAHAGAAIAVAVVGTTLSVALTMYSMRLASTLGARVTAALRTAMLRRAIRSSPGARERLVAKMGPAGPKRASGGDVVRVTVASTAPAVAEFIVTTFSNLPQIAFGLAVLFYDLVSSGAAIAAIGGVALFVISRAISHRATKRVSAAYAGMQASDASLFGRLGETLDNSEELRLLGARDQVVREFREVADACASARSEHVTALSASGQIKSAFTALSPLLVVLALQLAHHGNEPTPPGVVAKLVMLVPLLMARLDGFDGLRIGFVERRPMFEMAARVLALPAAPPAPEAPVSIEPSSLKGSIVFEHVTFAHEGAKDAQLDDVTLEIPAGAIVGICGKSGSGKSTLLSLLLRTRDPGSGRILVDGVDVRSFDPDLLPRIFGVLGQRASLLQRSLRENLALGLPETPRDASFEDALRIAGLEGSFGEGSPRTLDYAFRAGDTNLSGGEIRRLALARMILRDAPALLLDEPEAALPSADAEALLGRIKVAARGRTCVVVTHAPHLLPSSFNVFLENGRVVATGTHDELSQTCAPYRALLAQSVRGQAKAG